MSEFLVKWNVERLEMIVFTIMHQKQSKVKTYFAEKINEETRKEIQSQPWCENRQLSIEGISVEYSPNSVDIGNNKKNMNSVPI